jgi:hypothetical protein
MFSAQRDELPHQDLSIKRHEQEVHARNKAKNTSTNTHIVRRARGPMGVEGGVDICRLLQTLGTTSRGDLLNRRFWRLHHQSSFLQRRLIDGCSLNRRSSGSIFLRVLVVTEKETKGRDFT